MKETFWQKEEFQKLGKEKIAILQELAEKAKHKEPMELLELLPIYSKKLSGGNPIAPAEREALLAAMEQSLDNQERQRFQKAVQMLKMMGKL